MHENDRVHRDIRWPNVLKLEDNSWMLIDLENAVPKGEDGTFENVPNNFKDYNRSVRSKECLNWLPCDDVWMVGKLIMTLGNKNMAEIVTKNLVKFADKLMTEEHSVEEAIELLSDMKKM